MSRDIKFKAKLIKKIFSGGDYEYTLRLEGEIGLYAKSGVGHGWLKLSKQNCDELFGVVDVEKLADEYNFEQRNYEWKAYVAGFNKAMELNKDKVFTMEQLEIAFKSNPNNFSGFGLPFYKFLDTIQQPTEIEVEIEMEDFLFTSTTNTCSNFSKKFGCSDLSKCTCRNPKLDSDGCLILKRV
jgi:hypothetical protein